MHWKRLFSVAIVAITSAANTWACPTDKEFRGIFDQFALSSQKLKPVPQAATNGYKLYSERQIHSCTDKQTIRFLTELGDVLANAAGIVGRDTPTGLGYLGQEFQVRNALVAFVAEHPELAGADTLQWIRQNLKALAGLLAQKRDAKAFAEAMQQVPNSSIFTDSLVYDYLRATSSCNDWNWRGIEDYPASELTRRLCQDICRPYNTTFRQQVSEWRTINPRAPSPRTLRLMDTLEGRTKCD